MIPARVERRLLQAAIVVACVVPMYGGWWGVSGGLHTNSAASQSEVRYLSGLLIGVGLGFLACVPTIERRGREVRLLAGVVVVGGLCRLAGLGATGAAPGILVPLVMELGVTVLLALWRERVDGRLQSALAAHAPAR